MKRAICLVIFIAVIFFVFTSVIDVNAAKLLPGQVTPKPSATPEAIMPCVKLPEQDGSKNIIIQINNVASYSNSESVIKLNQIANSKQIPVVNAIIPQNIVDDKKLVGFLKQNMCNIEIAQQGSRISETPELKGMTRQEIIDRVVEGKSILQWVFGIDVTTFVPQQNWYGGQVLSTLKDVGYTTVSIEGWLKENVGVPSYSFYNKRQLTNAQIVNQCKAIFSYNKNCVVIIYPSIYKDNMKSFGELLDSLSGIKDARFTTFSN